MHPLMQKAGHRLVTQMYFPGDPLLEIDPIFRSVPAAARERLVRDRLAAYRDAVGHRPDRFSKLVTMAVPHTGALGSIFLGLRALDHRETEPPLSNIDREYRHFHSLTDRERLARVLRAAGLQVVEWPAGWQPHSDDLRHALGLAPL